MLVLRQANYTTYPPAGGLVASGGTDLLLAGVLRIVKRGAKTEVQSWADGSATGDTIARDVEAQWIYLHYYRALAIDQEFYWFMLQAAPADEMHWMTDSEMAKLMVLSICSVQPYDGVMGIMVSRTASLRREESKSIDFGDMVRSDPKRDALVVIANGIPNIGVRNDSTSRYNFTLVIPRRECAKILQTLANEVLGKQQVADQDRI